MQRYTRTRFGQPPEDVVWHYTDEAGALGILTSKTFWATHARHMNDGEEVQLFADLAIEEMRALKVQLSFHDMVDELNETIRQFSGWLQVNYFIVSFSTQPDALSQWRAYGGSKQGFALGFSKDQLATLGPMWRFQECIYSTARGKANLRKVLKEGIAKVRASKAEGGEPLELYRVVYSDLILLAPFFKDQAFAEEKEWRLVGGPMSGKNASFRTSKHGISPYVPLTIPRFDTGEVCLEEIVFGPGGTEETHHGVETLTGFSDDYRSVTIYSSTAPYRS